MRIIQAVLVTLFVSSCGGGSSNDNTPTNPTTPTPTNQAPTITLNEEFELFEGESFSTDVLVADADGDNITVSLSGDDAQLFTLTSSNVLSLTSALDYELLTQDNNDNILDIIISASDGTDTTNQRLQLIIKDAVEGRIIDGPVSGAKVFLDINNNLALDDNEPFFESNADGYFSLKQAVPPGAKLVSVGGTDTVSNKVLTDTVFAFPLNEQTAFANVSPISTLVALSSPETVQSLLDNVGEGLSVADLLQTDTWEDAEDNSEKAQQSQVLNTQIISVMNTAKAITGQDTAAALVSVANVITQSTDLSVLSKLSQPEAIENVLTSIVTESSTTNIDTDVIKAIAQTVASTNDAVEKNQDLITTSEIVQIVVVVQESLPTQIKNVVSGDISVEEFEEASETINQTVVVDSDNDGIPNFSDAFPNDATESVDTDLDGIGNNADADDDGDGVEDTFDAFPLDSTESVDTDLDGIGNNIDADDDDDGVLDNSDAFPFDATETLDTDRDGLGNNADTDDDSDGVADIFDSFPLNASEAIDTDQDNIGNNSDTDDDGDGVLDANDAFPLDATEYVDTDLDGIGNNNDSDDDGDGIFDNNDAFPLDFSESVDTDLDGIGNNADTDDDGDGVIDSDDMYPLDATQFKDTTSPVIILNGSASVTVEMGSNYEDAGAIVTDDVDNALQVNIQSNVNTQVLGNYTVTFNVNDLSGNAAQSVVRTVIVIATNTEVGTGQLTWGKHEYLRPQIEQAQASVVGMGEFFLGAAGVMLSDRHVLAKVAVITRGLEVDKNRKVVNIWGEVSAMKEVYWANLGDKESLCIIELETPFQNYHVPVIAQRDASEGELVFQVSHSAHVSNGNKGWAVSFGESMADFNMSDGLGGTTIPPLTAYANMDGNYGAGVFNEQGELIGLASGAQFSDITSPWYIPDKPLHNTIINSLETRSSTLTYDLSSIKNMMAQINLVSVPGGNKELPVNQLDVYETVLSDEEISVIEPVSEQSKNSVVTISQGGCSGTLFAKDLVLTNAHCVVYNRQLDIGFKGGEQLRGDAIALNEIIDLAVIKLRASPPSYYSPADISNVGFENGDIGYGLGSPGALWGKFGGWHVSPMKAKGYRRGDFIMSGYILPGSSGSGVFDSNGNLSSVLWGSGYGHEYLLVEGPLDRQDPHPFELSPSSHKSATVTMADFPTLMEFATRFNGNTQTQHEYIYDSVVTKDGQTYAVGRTYREGTNRALITRLTSQAQWDTTFKSDIDILDSSAVSIKQSTDGFLYILLQSIYGPQQIIRLLEDGTLDDDFANNGILNLDIGRNHLAIDMTIDQLGRLIVTGTVLSDEQGANIYVARWDASGQIDTTFNNAGWAELDVAGYGDYPQKVIVQDNHILVGGHTTIRNQDFAESDILLARFSETGQLDASYGENGLVFTQLREYDHEQLSDMALQSDGKLIVTGQNRGFGRVTVLRYLANGSLDPDFGDEGVVMLEDRYEIDVGVTILASDDGDIMVAGNFFERTSDLIEPGEGHYKIVVYRLDDKGRLNEDFAQGGRALLHSGNDDYAQVIKSLANGDTLIIGNSHSSDGAAPSIAVLSEKGDVNMELNQN